MDPEEVLKTLRELAKKVMETADEPAYDLKAVEMAEKFQELDEWIMSGGFLPKDWRRS